MREKGDVLRGIRDDTKRVLLSMFLSEPGGVSGRRRITIRLTKFPETPPDTFGGFFCGCRFQDLQATGLSGGPFLLELGGVGSGKTGNSWALEGRGFFLGLSHGRQHVEIDIGGQ